MDRRAARRAAASTAILLLVAAGFALAYVVRLSLCAALGGVVIGVALDPLVERVAAHGISRRRAGAFVFGTLGTLIVIALALLLPAASQQLASLLATLPELIARVQSWLQGSRVGAVRDLANLATPALRSAPDATPILAHAATLVGELLRLSYAVVLVVVMASAWADTRTRLSAMIRRLAPARRARSLGAFFCEAEHKIGTYARGQIIVCVSSAVVASSAYLAVGLPYALVLGLATGIAEIIPVLGPIGAGTAVALVTLGVAPTRFVWVIGIVVLNHTIQSYVVMPHVMDRAVGVRPLPILLSMSAFGALLGVGGAALAVPLAALVQLALDRLIAPRLQRLRRLEAY